MTTPARIEVPKYSAVNGAVYRDGRVFGVSTDHAHEIAEAMNFMQLEPGLIAKQLLWATFAQRNLLNLIKTMERFDGRTLTREKILSALKEIVEGTAGLAGTAERQASWPASGE